MQVSKKTVIKADVEITNGANAENLCREKENGYVLHVKSIKAIKASIMLISVGRFPAMSNQKSRNSTYDFLKFIGLSAIILAHVTPPSFIMMIRNFDVPLMVILSALLAKPSYNRHIARNSQPLVYIASRAKRLVFPTWIFLTFYFTFLFVGTGRPNSIQYYLASYALTQYGINYVWIILIYLYIAFLIPVFNKMSFSIKSLLTCIPEQL